MLVLSLESSTSSAKALLFDTEKGVVGSKNKIYGPDIYSGGKSDTDAVFQLIMSLGREIASGKSIDAIAICGTWHSIGVCDDSMVPVTPTFSWEFMEPSEQCRKIRKDKQLTREIYTRTGCMPHVTYPRHALIYLKENGYDLKGKKIISQGAYNFFNITGVFAESISTVSGSGLLNINTLKYDDFVLNYIGIDESQLGTLVTHSDIAPLNAKGASMLGISAGIPVVPAHPDGALNQVSNCAGVRGKMTFSVGTSAAIRLSSDRPILPDDGQLWCYYGPTGWLSGAAVSGACNCINWFMNDFLSGMLSFEQLERFEDVGGSVPVFLPFLFGERCPGWNDDRLGGFFDVNSSHNIRDFYRALQAGILFNILQCYEILCDYCGVSDEIFLSGGILNSAQWMQMAADIFGRELSCLKIKDASSIGAIVLALLAGKGISDISEIPGECMAAAIVRPRKEFADYYLEQYNRYKYWYDKTK